MLRSRDGSVGIAMIYGLGRLGFDSRKGQELLLHYAASISALKHTLSPTEWVLGAFSSGLKRLGRVAHQSPPSSTENKNGEAIPPFPHTSSLPLDGCFS